MSDRKKRCFVISPIGDEGSEERRHADQVFRHIIKKAMEKCGIEAVRSDLVSESGLISKRMFERILQDDLCIAVLTGQNPNVFYELAIAHAARRPVIILLQKGQMLPFDIKDMSCIFYDLDPDLLAEGVYVKEIVAHVRALEAAAWKSDTPIDILAYLQRSAQQKFFEGFGEDEIVMVLSPQDIDQVRPGTAIHTTLGAMELQEALDKQGYKVRREPANRVGTDALTRSLISVGGPIPNRVTRFLLDQNEIVYRFGGEEGHAIVSKSDPKLEIDAVQTGEALTRDFGILTRMRNPYNKERDAIVACGCFGWGTQAALRLLTDPESLEFLGSFDRHFQVLCTCLVDQDQVGTDAQLLDMCGDAGLRRETIVSLYPTARP